MPVLNSHQVGPLNGFSILFDFLKKHLFLFGNKAFIKFINLK